VEYDTALYNNAISMQVLLFFSSAWTQNKFCLNK